MKITILRIKCQKFRYSVFSNPGLLLSKTQFSSDLSQKFGYSANFSNVLLQNLESIGGYILKKPNFRSKPNFSLVRFCVTLIFFLFFLYQISWIFVITQVPCVSSCWGGGLRRHTPVVCNESREPHTSHYTSVPVTKKTTQPSHYAVER